MSDLPLFNSGKAEKFSSEEVLEQLKSSLAGLSDREAKERLSRFGPNAIDRQTDSSPGQGAGLSPYQPRR